MSNYFYHEYGDIITKINPGDFDDWSCSCKEFSLRPKQSKCICYLFAMKNLIRKLIQEKQERWSKNPLQEQT